MKTIPKLLGAIACAALISCGGGGDGGSSPSPNAPAAPTSYWTMNAYSYTNGFFSSQTTSTLSNGKQLTVAAISTATLSGGDTTNGAYSGSALTLSFLGSAPGTYNIVGDQSTLINSLPSANPIYVESNVGVAVTTGATLYAATSGQITVTRDSAGKFHFSSVTALPTTKRLDVLGGVAGAPATMNLTIHDAY
jgi:hypothetical protein